MCVLALLTCLVLSFLEFLPVIKAEGAGCARDGPLKRDYSVYSWPSHSQILLR